MPLPAAVLVRVLIPVPRAKTVERVLSVDKDWAAEAPKVIEMSVSKVVGLKVIALVVSNWSAHLPPYDLW